MRAAPRRVAAEQRGRPRSERARVAVLTAAADLMRADGFERLTVEGIATAAGVGSNGVPLVWGPRPTSSWSHRREVPRRADGRSGRHRDLRADLREWAAPDPDRWRRGTLPVGPGHHVGPGRGGGDGRGDRRGAHPADHGRARRPVPRTRPSPPALPAAPPSFLAETVGANLLLHVDVRRPLDEERSANCWTGAPGTP